jgi:hypothetical protein
MYSQTLGIHSDMLSLYNDEIEARSKVEAIESGDESGAMDFRTGLIRRRSVLGVYPEAATEGKGKEEPTVSPVDLPGETKEHNVAHLKRVIKRTERNRLKLQAMTETIDHSCELVRLTDTLYPIELLGMRADWKQLSAVGALLASVTAAIWRASA